MEWLNALIMGIVQGLAEYLPISSSGHLQICSAILPGFNLSDSENLQFNVLLHAATVLSTIVILWREFAPLCVSFFTFKFDSRFFYVVKILISCIPIAIVGFLFKPFVEQFFGKDLHIVGICLCVTALLLCFAYFFRTRPSLRSTRGYRPQGRDITYLDAFVIGCSQAVAVIPGLSRSGTTIATGILIGDNREKVAKFSFLMVVIPILGEAALDFKKMLFPSEEVAKAAQSVAEAAAGMSWGAMLIGFLASFIVGCLACKWMLNIVKKGKLVWFAVYCLFVGVACIIFG